METTSYTQMLGKLGSSYYEAYVRGAERYAKVVGNLLQSGTWSADPGPARQRYEAFVRSEAPKYLGQVAEAGLSYYRLVVESGIGAMDRYVEQVLRPAAATSPAAATTAANAAIAAAPSPAMLFRGRAGDKPGNAFVVANHKAEAVDVRFEVTDMTSDDGAARFRPVVEFEPASFSLAGLTEQVIHCNVLLTGDYQPGIAHRAQVHVVGFPEMTIRLSVQVDVNPTAA
jgi:hypothetical protein